MLTAGKYWIGDLCYVLTEKNGFDWMEVLEKTSYLGLYHPECKMEQGQPLGVEMCKHEGTGYFVFNDTTFFSSQTMYGDGEYFDNDGRNYGVDAGSIGCFPVEDLGSDPEGLDLGHVVEFGKDFDCCVVDRDGAICIDLIEIKTDWENEDEDY